MKITAPTNVVNLEIPANTPIVKPDSFSNVYDELLLMCKQSQIEPCEASKVAATKANVVSILNANHSIVQQGSKTLVCEVSPDYKGCIEYKFTNVENKKAFYQNVNLTYETGENDQAKTFNCFNTWLRHLERNTYQGVVFDPSMEAPKHFLNMWQGFKFEPVAGTSKLDKILWHFEHVLCNGDQGDYQYLMAWLSHIFQHPEIKTGVCLALKSEERGTGKSTLIEILNRLLGQHAGRISDGKHLLGSFNSHLANKLVVAVEESFWSGSPKDAGKLRTMITESTITIEGKHKDAIEVSSFHRFILLTNNDWVVPASSDERRFFVLRVSDCVKQDKAYFTELYSVINDDEAMGQLLNYFMAYDLSPYDLRKAKVTEENRRQILESMQPHEEWLQNILDEGYIVDSYDRTFDFNNAGNPVPKAALYDDYIRYCNKMKLANYSMLNNRKIGEYINKVIQPLDSNVKAFISGRPERVNCYKLKSLEEMQILFNKYYCQ